MAATRSIERLPGVAAIELVTQYERAARLLRSMIVNAVQRGALGTARERRKQLAAVNRLLAELRANTSGLAVLSIAGGYRSGASIADTTMLDVLPKDVAEQLIQPVFASGANKAAIQALQAATEQKLAGSVRTVGRSVDDVFSRVGLEQVSLGTAAGLSRTETSKRIAAKLADEGVTSFVDRAGRRWKLDIYAPMVARTTQREAVTLGVVDRMTQVGLDLVTISKHRDSCDICKSFEGKTYSLTGRTPGYEVITIFPPFHPNAIAEGSTVSASRVDATSRAAYEGPLLHVTTAGGIRLSVTPNHPVLTARGWISAQSLRRGDDVLCGGFGERDMAPGAGEDLNHGPALVEEVFNAWAAAFGAAHIPAAPADLHGDARFVHGDIDVVSADGLLLGDIEAVASEFGRESSLILTGASASGLAGASAGFEGREGVGAAIGRTLAHFDSSLSETPEEGRSGDWEVERDLLRGLSCEIATDRIVEIRYEDRWTGHVFDLQTGTGTYFANGLYTHNCRHVLGAAKENLTAALDLVAAAA